MAQTLAIFADDLQSRGRYSFTGADIARAHPVSAARMAAVRRLKKQGRLAVPRRGFYVIVPLEYREAGGPPASWFIDDLMRYLEQPYYVGLLSAAAIHGAAHQQPMVFQVITDRPTRPARAGRVRIEFHMSRQVESVPTVEVQTETGSMQVSTPEASAFDLVRFAPASGHLSNVATVIAELAEILEPKALAALAPMYRVPEVQRLGYLLDLLGKHDLAAPLAVWLGPRRFRWVRLAPEEPNGEAEPDPRWRVIPNAAVEAER